MPYQVSYAPEALEHLRRLTGRERRIVKDAVNEQLTHEAAVETRNRHPRRPGGPAAWELRIGSLRVYYDVHESERAVVINAVGVKRRDRIIVPGVGELEL